MVIKGKFYQGKMHRKYKEKYLDALILFPSLAVDKFSDTRNAIDLR
jgi:hypothetical protein